MAITRAIGVGKSTGSVGDWTYRVLRGRTISSQKRGKADTRALTLTRAQAIFGMISMFMEKYSTDIQVSFNKSKYGSQRNYFFRINKRALEAALEPLIPDTMVNASYPPVADVENAIAAYATENPTKILRVKLQGFENVFLTGAWSHDDNPISGGAVDGLGVGEARTQETGSEAALSAPTAISLNYHAGAKIVRGAGKVTLTGAGIPSGTVAANIQYLTANGTPIEPAIEVTEVTSIAGEISFTSPAIPESSNVLAVKIGNVFVRLTSAYVRGGGVDENPFGRR